MSTPAPNGKTRILDAATRLFAERGYEGTSLQAVADAAGMRKPSLLHHFASKDDLREEVIERVMSRWKGEIPTLLTAANTGKDRFTSTVMALVEFLRDEPNRARLAAREMLDRPEATRERIHRHVSPFAPLIVDYIQMGKGSHRVRADVDPEAYVIEVVIMAVGTVAFGEVAAAASGPGTSIDMDRQINELVRIARVGLFAQRAPTS